MTAPAVAVVGPTASGKSSVAMAIAATEAGVELVSIDSMQVYRGMDIGTAKPSADDRAAVAHHLIDLIDPTDEFAVAEFQRAYRAVIADIGDRGARAVLVGGTGLYHRAVIDDLELPGEWPAIRTRLMTEAHDSGLRALHARLTEVDPVAAAKMEPTNERRVVRALEVCEGSGRRFSSYGPGLEAYPPSRVAQIGVRWDRTVQAARIEQRVHDMIASGLLDEVRRLLDVGLSRTAAQALGYRELIAHLDGECSFDEAVERTVTRTRQFAVRQLRWFGRDPRVRWVDVEHDPVAEAAPLVREALHHA
ncbi:MAG: tRNA (adenosine(37)-N6)-dimethylallyltransferase MiaA [Ilumatobacteraceae bacterium]